MSPNQFSNRPPFCDFLERYQSAHRAGWSHVHLMTARVGMGRFDEWLKVSQAELSELDWQKMMEFYRFLSAQGISARAAARSVQIAKHALKWAIERGELPQKVESLYTFHHSRRHWNTDLPAPALEFVEEFTGMSVGTRRIHAYGQRVFHTFLSEKGLSYRRLQRNHLAQFVRYVSDQGFSQQSRMSLCSNARTFLRWLYERRLIKRTPDELFPGHMIPKMPKRLPRPLQPEIDQRLQTILEETDDIYYKGILLLRRTGMRVSELRKLSFDCIEYDLKKRPRLKVPAVKLGLERRVPLDPKTVDLIKLIQKKTLRHYRRNRAPAVLIIGPNGKPGPYERYSDAMTELCARLNVKKWINLHALRHTYATSLLSAGISIVSLKEILGHKTIIMTLLYAKVTQEQIHAEYNNAISKMDHHPGGHLKSGQSWPGQNRPAARRPSDLT